MAGALLLLAGAALSFYAGFVHWAWYTIPAIAIVWVVGYFLFKPRSIEVLKRSPTFLISQWIANSIGSAILYGIGYAVSLLF